MVLNLTPLENLRLPSHLEKSLLLDSSSLQVLSENSYDNIEDETDVTPAIGIATVLYNWNPFALLALIDVSSWFSMTWTLTLPDSTKLEIGRIRNQITFGKLDKEGLWKVMITFTVSQSENGLFQGPWIPNIEESMLGDKNIEDPAEIDTLARGFVKELIAERRWLTGKGLKHEFFVESEALGMDPWDDGLAMSPYWLYEALDLSKCTTCTSSGKDGKALNRCGRCGTAAYCCAECQQKDWAVHKAVCAMSAEARGKALHYSRDGGLVYWKGDNGVANNEEEDDEASKFENGPE